MSLDNIEWDVELPPRKNPKRTGLLTVQEIAVAAQMRPGVWGRYQFDAVNQSNVYAHRLRERGINAHARGKHVYFVCDR